MAPSTLTATEARAALQPAIDQAMRSRDPAYVLKVWVGNRGGLHVAVISDSFSHLSFPARDDVVWPALQAVDAQVMDQCVSVLLLTREEADNYAHLPAEVAAS